MMVLLGDCAIVIPFQLALVASLWKVTAMETRDSGQAAAFFFFNVDDRR